LENNQIVFESFECTELISITLVNGVGLNKKSPVVLGIKTNNHETQINEIIKPQMY